MRRSSASLVLVAIGCCSVADAFLAGGAPALAIRADASSSAPILMMAKKKAKPRKPDKKPIGGSGLGGSVSPAAGPTATPTPASMDAPMASPASPASANPDAPLDQRLDDILASAGMMQSDQSLIDAKREPQSPLSSMPVKGQELLERFFGGGAIIFGSAFILAGIAVAFEAVCKVAKVDLPVAVDEAIVQYIFPSLTPSILILFFFSISLGLLKQVSAEKHGCSPSAWRARARASSSSSDRAGAVPRVALGGPLSSPFLFSSAHPPFSLSPHPLAHPLPPFWHRSSSSAPRLAASCTRRTMTIESPVALARPVRREAWMTMRAFESRRGAEGARTEFSIGEQPQRERLKAPNGLLLSCLVMPCAFGRACCSHACVRMYLHLPCVSLVLLEHVAWGRNNARCVFAIQQALRQLSLKAEDSIGERDPSAGGGGRSRDPK